MIAYNMQSLVTPIRHIIELNGDVYDEAEFVKLYYERYNKLEGDEFTFCLSTKQMREKEAEIVKEYDEAMSKEERRKNWKEYCAQSAEKGSATE
jgi:hypothetical protein